MKGLIRQNHTSYRFPLSQSFVLVMNVFRGSTISVLSVDTGLIIHMTITGGDSELASST